jgi:hypothetical protein
MASVNDHPQSGRLGKPNQAQKKNGRVVAIFL